MDIAVMVLAFLVMILFAYIAYSLITNGYMAWGVLCMLVVALLAHGLYVQCGDVAVFASCRK